MNRRFFVRNLTVGAIAGVASHRAYTAEPGAPESKPTTPPSGTEPSSLRLANTPLVVQAPRADGFEAVWSVSRLAKGKIEWERDDGTRGTARMNEFGFVPQGSRLLRVRVASMAPGANYRVRSVTIAADDQQEEVSPWKSFRTLDPGAKETRFAVWNDTHVNDTTLRRLDEVTPPADFLVWNGDTCNDWRTEDILVPTLLHPAGRDITQGRPLNVIWGNHDVRGPWAFRMPEMIATPSGRPFHAFRSGPAAVICLHTGEDKPDNHPSFGGRVAFDALRQEQAAWLAETIRRPEFAHAPYRLIFCHIPLRWIDESVQDYSKDGFDRHSGRSRAAWHDALVHWKAQVIISGHTHNHAWLPPTPEFPYGQLIGGGPQPNRATWIEGTADATNLRLVARNLEGAILHDITLDPIG